MSADDPTNATRGGRAEGTLRAYAQLKQEVPEPENDLVDLLADLMHFAGQRGVDFEAAQATARMHFEAETEAASVADWGMKCPDCDHSGIVSDFDAE